MPPLNPSREMTSWDVGVVFDAKPRGCARQEAALKGRSRFENQLEACTSSGSPFPQPV